MEQYLTLIDKILELKAKDLSWIRSEAFKNQFSEEEKDLLNQFLKRIKNTEDFKKPRTQGNVLATISHILEACAIPAFKENLFVLIQEALASCSDRIAITLNRIEIQRRLLSPELTSDLKKFSHFLITYQRLQLVHEEAVKIIEKKGLGDAIEPMLFLQIQLKELLDLPIATEGMLYPAMAHISNEEVESIGHTILSQSESKEQHTKILCTPPQTIYNAAGMPIKTGNISPTNPFFLNIPEFWEKALTSKYPKEFKDIEPPSDDRELRFYLTSEELQEYNKATDPETVISRVHTQKKQALILELTNNNL